MNSSAWNWCGHGVGTGSSAEAILTPAVKTMKMTISMSGRLKAMCLRFWLMRRGYNSTLLCNTIYFFFWSTQ